jgi:hypothetical protein
MIAAQWCVQWAGGWVALEHGTRERDRAGWLPIGSDWMYLRACAIRTRPSGQLGILSKEQYSPAATAAEPTHVQLHVHSLCISMATYVRTHACQLPGIHACTYYMSATCRVRCACEASQCAKGDVTCIMHARSLRCNHQSRPTYVFPSV